MQNLTATAQQIDRRVKGILRGVDIDLLVPDERKLVQKLRLACNEVKLDVRDYEYAQARIEQQKWAMIARHNMQALETLLLALGDIFGPVDIAELSAHIDALQSGLE